MSFFQMVTDTVSFFARKQRNARVRLAQERVACAPETLIPAWRRAMRSSTKGVAAGYDAAAEPREIELRLDRLTIQYAVR
jgi:hypothetical protein